MRKLLLLLGLLLCATPASAQVLQINLASSGAGDHGNVAAGATCTNVGTSANGTVTCAYGGVYVESKALLGGATTGRLCTCFPGNTGPQGPAGAAGAVGATGATGARGPSGSGIVVEDATGTLMPTLLYANVAVSTEPVALLWSTTLSTMFPVSLYSGQLVGDGEGVFYRNSSCTGTPLVTFQSGSRAITGYDGSGVTRWFAPRASTAAPPGYLCYSWSEWPGSCQPSGCPFRLAEAEVVTPPTPPGVAPYRIRAAN